MIEIQPPRMCQFCSVDLNATHHKMTCRIVTEIEGIAGWLDLPARLDRRKPKTEENPVDAEETLWTCLNCEGSGEVGTRPNENICPVCDGEGCVSSPPVSEANVFD